ncbi:sugar transferase [Lysinibacillus sp. LZ02]|uniref:sugar transferase n=1 Tax=Lysinibacillus sp. LZ02 TaxID=3420668 RepID=UPI003D35A915
MKRLLDIIISFIALCICILPMICIAVAIKLTSKGPILFKQKRVGVNETYFQIYKFRTMYINTPNVSTESLGDPGKYITSLGKFLRKTSLDELPQLLNILRGDMAIVGPRPALYNQYELIESREKLGVNSIRPGLTGYAQIMGRDFISDNQKVEYDYYYLKNKSLLFDLKIMWQTVFSVAKADGVKVK